MRRFVRYPTDAFPLVFLPLLFSPPPPRFWPCYYKYFYFLSDKKQCNEPALKRTPLLNSKYPEKHKLCHRFLPFLEFFVLSIHIIWKWHGSFGIALYILVILRFSEQRLLSIVSPLSKYLNFHISVFYNLLFQRCSNRCMFNGFSQSCAPWFFLKWTPIVVQYELHYLWLHHYPQNKVQLQMSLFWNQAENSRAENGGKIYSSSRCHFMLAPEGRHSPWTARLKWPILQHQKAYLQPCKKKMVLASMDSYPIINTLVIFFYNSSTWCSH